MRVLVTGATAPLGRALVAALAADAAVEQVLATGVEADGDLAGPRVTYLPFDLTRPRDVHDLLSGPARRLGIDAVVHTALHRSAKDGGPRIHAENVETTRELLLGCTGHPTIRRFVYRSAAEV